MELLSETLIEHTEISQIPLPQNAFVPGSPFRSEDLERVLDAHYMYIVANLKLIKEQCAVECAPKHMSKIKVILSKHAFILTVVSQSHCMARQGL